MRFCVLHLKLGLRGLGAGPFLAMLVFCVVAGLQEPTFFRSTGLDLLWPACASAADILTLCVVTTWLGSVGMIYGIQNLWVAAGAVLVVAVLCAGWGAAACTVMDSMTLGRAEPWRIAARAWQVLLVWVPIAMLAAGLASRALGVAWRVLVLMGAFLTQSAIQGLSMAAPEPGLDKVLASVLAFTGSLSFTLASPAARQARPA